MQGLYALKPWYTARLEVVVEAAVRRGISPDAFTVLGVLGAAVAFVALGLGWWPVALVALLVRLGGANLDGAVARARGVSRPWGFVVNELGDRASDLLLFAGLAWLAARTGEGPGAVVWVLVAAVAATLPTFVSLSGAGAGAARRNGGPLGKAERCALAVLACAVPTWLVPVSLLLVAGSVLTALTRLRGVRAELARPEG